MPASSTALDARDDESASWLMVGVRGRDFALDVLAVREIRGWSAPTPLLEDADYVSGMLNLRGLVIPIVDLGVRLGLGAQAPTRSSAIVIAEHRTITLGLVVDNVIDMVTVPRGAQRSATALGGAADGFLAGTATIGDRIVGLLRLENVVPPTMAKTC